MAQQQVCDVCEKNMEESKAVVEPIEGRTYELCEKCRATAGNALTDRYKDSSGAPF